MMPLKGQTTEAGVPASQPLRSLPEAAAVRLQLDRLLASPQFRTSKRCQALLSHVIESYLDGALERVKERIIGFEVFGRDPGYDTNHDSVVRTTAAEVRKRLAQYYLEPNHEQEIRFLLPPGSYVPEFRLPSTPPAPVPDVATPAILVEPPPPPAQGERPRRRIWIWAVVPSIMLATAMLWFGPRFRPTELDAFWRPLLEDRADVVICIEQPLRIYGFEGPRVDELNEKMVGAANSPPAPGEVLQGTVLKLSELKTVGSRYFSFGDTIASIRVAELLARKGKPFQVLGDRATSYRDLRGRPAVLVGEFNNQWTNGLIRGLRYYIEKNAETYDVRDRQNGGRVIASVTREVTRPAEYAIVSRVFDSSTEKTIIAVAGMTYAGTGAVGDFLTTPSYMHEAFQNASAGWNRKNIQVVLETALVSGTAGPPKVVATHFW